jgi:hypothetical protein
MIALVLGLCFASLADSAYAEKDSVALRGLLEEATTREDSLYATYRLFALTQDRRLIARIPGDLDSANARELALLSALWGYRVRDAGLLQVIRWGRRSNGLLNRAVAMAPDDPLVGLIEAQALLYRPRFAGGDKRAAVSRLRALVTQEPAAGACRPSGTELRTWLWYAMRKVNDPEADTVKTGLEALELPTLYREFLLDPP